MEKIFDDNRLTCLFIIDNPDLVYDLQSNLGKQFNDYELAVTAVEAEEFVEKSQPHIMLFGKEDLAKSHELYLKLIKNNKVSQFHRTVLMVQASDSEQAAKLCMDKVFNDYIVVNPLFDKGIFNSAIFRAIEVIQEHNNQNKSSDVDLQLRKLKKATDENKKIEAELRNEARASQQKMKAELSDNIDQFTGKVINDIKTVKDSKALTKSLTEFSNSLNQSLDKADKAASSILDGLEEASNKSYDEINAGLSQAIIPRTILLIEDDPFYLKVLSRVLVSEGFTVKQASTGKLGIELIAQCHPDVIILDWTLPDIMGSFVLKTLKTNIKYSHVPVIILTGNSQPAVVKEAIALGALGFIVKPSNKEQLIQKIESALYNKKL